MNNGSCKHFLHNCIYHFFSENEYLAYEICQLCHYSTCVMIFFFVSRVNYVLLFQIYKITYCTILVLTSWPVNLCKSATFGSDIFFPHLKYTLSMKCIWTDFFFSSIFILICLLCHRQWWNQLFFCRMDTQASTV